MKKNTIWVILFVIAIFLTQQFSQNIFKPSTFTREEVINGMNFKIGTNVENYPALGADNTNGYTTGEFLDEDIRGATKIDILWTIQSNCNERFASGSAEIGITDGIKLVTLGNIGCGTTGNQPLSDSARLGILTVNFVKVAEEEFIKVSSIQEKGNTALNSGKINLDDNKPWHLYYILDAGASPGGGSASSTASIGSVSVTKPVETNTVFIEVPIEKIVEVEKIIEKEIVVEKQVDNIVEKEVIVEVPIDKIVEVEKIITKEKPLNILIIIGGVVILLFALLIPRRQNATR